MTIDRDALVEKATAAIERDSELNINCGSETAARAALDAILPEVQADAYKRGWDEARAEGCSDEFAAGLWDEGCDAALPFSEIRADSYVRNQLHARNPYRKAASE